MVLTTEGRRERYVAERLKREGRGGSVTERPDGTIVYERWASDSMEMLPFLRTFTGRILSLRGDNRRMLRRFHDDLRRMEALYSGDGGSVPCGPMPKEGSEPRTARSGPKGDAASDGGRCRAADALFHEAFGRYYVIGARLLERADREGPLTPEAIRRDIARWGFAETPTLLLPPLAEGEWPLFRRGTDRSFIPRLRSVRRPLSTLERRWLAALLEDERMGLFLEPEALRRAKERLAGVAPLFQASDLCAFDRSRDPDPFRDEEYRSVFRTVLTSLREGRLLWARFTSGHGREVRGNFLPRRLQYSLKDDRFRLLARRADPGLPAWEETINLARIRCAVLGERCAAEVAALPPARTEPVVLLLTEERQAMERALLHFASFPCRPQAGPDGERLLHILYDAQDEKELLIRVLAFGPLVRVLGPERFVEMVRRRVREQARLLGHAAPQGEGDTKGAV